MKMAPRRCQGYDLSVVLLVVADVKRILAQFYIYPARVRRRTLCLVTREVDEWYQKLRDRNVKFEKEPAYNPEYNIYHCFLRDPNGYLVEIQRFCDPAWPPPVSS